MFLQKLKGPEEVGRRLEWSKKKLAQKEHGPHKAMKKECKAQTSFMSPKFDTSVGRPCNLGEKVAQLKQ